MKISPARKSAFEILIKIDREKAFSSILLPQYEQQLDQRDRSLCHQLTLGVLRNKIYLDKILDGLVKGKLKKFDLEVLVALRLGLYQILFLDKIPAYSAISESVDLTKFAKKRSASGLVNAVLRKASKSIAGLDYPDDLERISIDNSHPRWLIERWERQFGLSEAEAIAKANNAIPNLTFRFTKRFESLDAEDRNRLIMELESDDQISKSKLVENCFVAAKFTRKLASLAEESLIYFQEEASQLTANSIQLKPGEKFLDVCASPGSKATYIAAFGGFESTFVAGDLYRHRVENLAANARSQGAVNIQTVCYDAEKELPFREASFDIVLVDAPCTGTGTIRRNPEIRYSLKEEDFKTLPDKQLRILQNASKLIKHGGKMIYSTCSIDIEENEGVIKRFLGETDEFSIISPKVPDKFLTDSGFARIYPHRDALDGFFIAALVKSQL